MAQRITIKLHHMQRQKFERIAKASKDADERMRYLIILKYDEGKGSTIIARELHCAGSTARRVAHRYLALGEAGLVDGRCDNGPAKVTEECHDTLVELLEGSPQDYGWARTTWTLELLAKQIQIQTGVSLHAGTVSRLLKTIRARKKRPKPIVGCPWPKRKREERVAEIERFLADLPEDEVAVYEDEVDIHLNPKIGPDWMLPGVQKTVLTPGQNHKRYIAGALNPDTGHIHYVESDRKRSALFVQLLNLLAFQVYPNAKRIHLIVDNYIIHTSKITQKAVEALNGRIVLHFLPPYCPDANRIERLWKELHDNVTRNHRCKTIDELMQDVREFIKNASPYPGSKPSLARRS